MKKVLSVFVVLALLATTVFSALPVHSRAVEPLMNWSFEENDLAALGTPEGADEDGYYAVGDLSIVSGGAYKTKYALKISGAECGNGQWLVDLKPGTKYSVKFWAKIANWGGSAYPKFGVNGYDGDAYVAEGAFTEEWQQYHLTFVTGADSTMACVYTWIYGSGAVDFFVDEVVVEEGEGSFPDPEIPSILLEGWDFEKNDLTAIGTPDGADEDGYYAVGDVSIVSGGAKGTEYALKISGAECGNGQWLVDLKPATKYTVKFWAKIANWGGSAYPKFGINGYDGDAYVAEGAFTEEWQQYRLVFETGADSTMACVYTWIYGSGDVDFFLDEVTITEGDTPILTPGSLDDWDFEKNDLTAIGTPGGSDEDGYYAVGDVSIVSGGAKGTNYALKVSGAECGNGQWLVDLKPATKYTVKFWAKIANWGGSAYPSFGVNGYDGEAYVAESAFTEEWQQYRLTFETGADSTMACVYTWIYGSGDVDFFVDEVTITEGDTPILTPGSLDDWDFEKNDLAALGTPDGSDEDGYYAVGDVSIVSGGAKGTNYALKVSGAECGNGQWLVDLKPATKYTVKFWAKIANWGGSAYPAFGVNGYDGEAYVAESAFTEDWAQYRLTFETGAESTMACVYTWIYGFGAVDFFVDEVTITEGDEPVLTPGSLENWDFEKNDLAALGTPDGSDEDGYYAVGDVSIVSGGANGTTYALKVSGAEHGNGQWLVDLKPGTEYTVKFWAKIANWGGSAYPAFGINGYDGEAYVAESAFYEDWRQFRLTFTTGADSTMACVYTWIYGSGDVDFFIDEVTIIEGTEPVLTPGSLENWDFEKNDPAALGTPDGTDGDGYYAVGDVSIVPGGANGTKYALKISGVECGNGQWLVDLKPEKGYTVTFWAKIANWGGSAYPAFGINGYDGEAYVTEGAFSEEWAQYQLTFKTGANSTMACVYTWIYGSSSVDFYIDEVTITEKPENIEPPKPCDGGKDCPSYAFKDVNAGDWYHEAVDFAVERGLFNGMTNTTFEPNTPMTRAMLVTVLWRYEGSPEEGKNTFTDVPADSWYTKAVAWASANGIVGGVGNNRFDPNGNITREQLAAILYRYSNSKGYDTSVRGDFSAFPDKAKISSWATDAYGWAVGAKLITGNNINGKTMLDPQGNATRAQVATILMRFINASMDPNLDGTFSVLLVGNSYSVDTMEYVYQIAKSAGVKDVVLGVLYYGGCTIEQHYGFWKNNSDAYEFFYVKDDYGWVSVKNAKWTDGLDFYDWDYIGFQQSSHLANDKDSFRRLGDLLAMAKERCPKAKMLYNMTWCRPLSYIAGSELPHFSEIVQTADEITSTYGIAYMTAPGTAIENLRTSYIDKALLYRDEVHLSLGIGRYTAGLAFFTQLTGISIEKIAYKPGSVSEEYKTLAIEAAMNAAKNSKEVTPSKYPAT